MRDDPRICRAVVHARKDNRESNKSQNRKRNQPKRNQPIPIGSLIRSLTYRRTIIHAYAEWLVEEIEHGCIPYFLTFTFNHLNPQNGPILAQMENEVERFYSTLVTRFERNPRSPRRQKFLPRLHAFPDLPTFKNRKYQYGLRDFTVNGGLHIHGILRIPEVSRFKGDLRLHITENQLHYVKHGNRLYRLDVELIRCRPENVTDYAYKAFKYGRVDPDHMLILPKSITELPPKWGPEPTIHH
jgi:hypothetical protein